MSPGYCADGLQCQILALDQPERGLWPAGGVVFHSLWSVVHFKSVTVPERSRAKFNPGPLTPHAFSNTLMVDPVRKSCTFGIEVLL